VLAGDYTKDPSSSTTATNSNRSSISLQPLLGLGKLQELQLDMWCADGAVPAAEKIAQLSTLRSLQEVRVEWDSYQLGDDHATVEGTAAAFAVLPLKALSLCHAGVSVGFMQQLGCVQGLTALDLEGMHLPTGSRVIDSQVCATPAQLAAALRQLPALRYLRLFNDSWGHVMDIAAALQADDCDGVVELLQAIDGLKHLSVVCVELPVRLKRKASKQLDMQQLVPNILARGCTASVSQGLVTNLDARAGAANMWQGCRYFARTSIESPARSTLATTGRN
jgi:hypothetical protein